LDGLLGEWILSTLFFAPSPNKNVKRYVKSFSWAHGGEKYVYIYSGLWILIVQTKNVFSVRLYVSTWPGDDADSFA